MRLNLRLDYRSLAVGVALILIWLLFLGKSLGSEYSFAIFQDNEFFLAPVLSHISRTIHKGDWPVWINTVLGGLPLYNFTQLSPFYPFYLTSFPLFESPLEAIRSMHLITLGHVLLFELNAYVLLRTIKISRLASLAGSVLIVFNANNLSYAVWVNIMAPYAWLPLYLAGLIRLLEVPTSRKAILLTLFSIVMLTMASPAQPLIHAVFISIVLLAFHTVKLIENKKGIQLKNGLLTLSGVSIIAVLITSPVLIPAILDFKDMIRWVGAFPPVYGNMPIPFEAFLTDQLTIHDLIGVLLPIPSKRAIGSEFVGLLPIVLLIFAFAKKDRLWLVWPLGLIAIYSLLSATGSNLGLAYINYHLPLINKIREPSRFLFLFHFCVGILAAMGIEQLRVLISRSGSPSEALKALGGASTVLLAGLVVTALLWAQIKNHESILVSALVMLILMGISALVIQYQWTSKSRHIVFGWVIAVIILQRILVPWTAPLVTNSDYLSQGKANLDIALERLAEKDPSHSYRVIFGGQIDSQTTAMLASYRGLRTFNAYFNPAPRRQFEELYYHGPRQDNYFRALGAKYLLCKECGTDALVGYTHLEDIGEYSIYESSDVLPHTYIANSISGEFRNLAEYADKISKLELSKTPLLIEPDTWLPDRSAIDPSTAACIENLVSQELNRMVIIVKCSSSGVLVLNEFFTDAWKATVNGKPASTLRVNGNQIGTPFPPGSHMVEFQYKPRIFQISLLLAIVGIAGLIFLLYFVKHLGDGQKVKTIPVSIETP